MTYFVILGYISCRDFAIQHWAVNKKRDAARAASFFLAHTLPQVLAETLSYCNAMYCPAVVLGAAPIVAHAASVAAAAKTVVDPLKRTTASGLEQ
jgi:hypothetical protein